MSNGFVYLVGAGPGDPGLITVSALEALSQADCIIYDFLANPLLIDNYTCEKIYVGKSGSHHTLAQEEINRLIIKKAIEGKTVVRLKGGDPFIFGRGGEEAEKCVDAGVPFAVVPGISSFYSAPTYAGIPITHRDYAHAFEVVTGHRRADANQGNDIRFPEYHPDRTYTFLMGVKNLPHITTSLLDKGFPPDLPAAVISRGTRPNQQVVVGTIANIVTKAQESQIRPPAIILFGNVVKFRQKLRWYDNLPLFGKQIVVTRTRSQASALSKKLTALGAQVIEFPTITIQPADDLKPLKKALAQLQHYDWVCFTSQHAVTYFFESLFQSGRDARALGTCRIAAIGPATSDELRKYGLRPDLIPDKYVADSLVAAMRVHVGKGSRILLPCSAIAPPTLANGLTAQGAEVDSIYIYQNHKPQHIPDEKLSEVRTAHMVTFTSSSTARNFFELVPDSKADFVSIGPVTSKTMDEMGHPPHIEASESTINGIVNAILKSVGP